MAGYGQDYVYQNFTTKEGLPDQEVFTLLKDSKGYIWGGTNFGIFRYNGYAFQLYNLAKKINENAVFCLAEDKRGRIWFSTINAKVGYVENDSVYFIPANDEIKKMFIHANSEIFTMVIEPDNSLLLGTTGYPIRIPAKFNYTKAVLIKEVPDSVHAVVFETADKQAFSSIVVSDRGSVKSSSGIFSFYFTVIVGKNKITRKVTSEKGMNYIPHQKQLRLSNGNILYTYQNQLFIIKPDMQIIEKKYPGRIILLHEDADHHLWIGMKDKGVLHYENANPESEPELLLPGKSVSAVIKDHQGAIWLSTFESGLFYISNPSLKKVVKYPELNKGVVGFSPIGDSLYVVSQFGSVFSSGNTGGFICRHEANTSDISTAFLKKVNGRYYFSGAPPGIVFEKKNGIIPFSGTRFLTARALLQESDSSLLFLSGTALYRIVNEDIHKTYALPSRGYGMTKTTDGKIFIASLDGLFEFAGDTVQSVIETCSNCKEKIFRITSDNRGNLYLLVWAKGISIKTKAGWIYLTEQDGVIHDQLSCIYVDDHGVFPELWVGSRIGISHIIFQSDDLSRYSIENYEFNFNFPNTLINHIVKYNNKIWFGSKEGLAYFDLQENRRSQLISPVYIHHIEINGQKKLNEIPLTLSHADNSLKIKVDVLNFQNNSKVYFRYKLNGFDNTLRESKSDLLEYPNLPPGDYELLIYDVADKAGKYPFRRRIEILKPFWLNWWFIILSLILFTALCWFLVLRRIGAVRKREKEKHDLQLQLSEIKLQSLRSQMNPHFIFNVINSIQRYILEKDKHEAYTYLTRFSELIRRILNNAGQNTIPLSEELELLNLYVELEQLRFDKNIRFEIFVDNAIDIHEFKIPGLLIQPVIENAIWHGITHLGDKRVGVVAVAISLSGNKLKISVEDNGIGRAASAMLSKSGRHKSKGIQIIQERIMLFNNTALPGLIITDLQDDEGVSCGTRVEIYLNYE